MLRRGLENDLDGAVEEEQKRGQWRDALAGRREEVGIVDNNNTVGIPVEMGWKFGMVGCA